MVNKITPEEIERFLAVSDLTLNASQEAISFPIIERIHRRLQQGHRFSPIKVLNGIIVDGHHRYVCLSILGIAVENVQAGRNNASVETFHWSDINVDSIDYDTLAEIKAYERKYD